MTSLALQSSLCLFLLLGTGTPSQALNLDTPIFFPDSTVDAQTTQTTEEVFDDTFPEKVNQLSSLDDFASFFNVDLPKPNISISTRVGGGRPIALELQQAVCTPELTTVQLDLPHSNGAAYFPTCVRVERCGGCCYLSHHVCKPTRVEKILVKAVKLEDDVSRSRRRRVRNAEPEYISVGVEKHLECDCQCRLGASDCNPAIHTYNERQCECLCNDRAGESACLASRDHFWNNDQCTCMCRNPVSCSSGQSFDTDTCRCVFRGFDYPIDNEGPAPSILFDYY